MLIGARTTKKDAHQLDKQEKYHVHSWRIDEYQASLAIQNFPSSDTKLGNTQSPWFPLPADHLLHLIKYNVFRGLDDIKRMLECLTRHYATPEAQYRDICQPVTFPGHSVIFGVDPVGFGPLTPIPLQMSIVHSTWINLIPFSAMREKLIIWEFNFDHCELMRDLVGDQVNVKIFSSAPSVSNPLLASGMSGSQEFEEEISSETGMILWGEPHLESSWEATPHFVQKWAWALVDCTELIESTNHWRSTRGESPIKLPQVPSPTINSMSSYPGI